MGQAERSADQARAELYAIMREEIPFEDKADRALALGKSYLGVDNGHITRINEQTDYWEAIGSTDPPDGAFPPGQILDLQTTYCRRTIAADSPIALHDAQNQGWADDPAFQTHGLHCYHGTTLTVDDEVYGTVCFVSTEPREEPFTDGETMFAELISRLLEHELEHAKRDAELDRRGALIGVFSRVLRHNLRNNLSVVRGSVELLRDRFDDETGLTGTALANIDELIDLCNTARKFESVDDTRFEEETVDLMVLLERVKTVVQTDFPSATVTVQGPEEVLVRGLDSLGTAFEEIVENAAKHGGDEPQVTITVSRDTDMVHVDIVDDGPGLPAHERNVLSEGGETSLVHGSGLGLWLAYWIVSTHEGRIRADVTDHGTTVTVSLPAALGGVEGADAGDLPQSRFRDRFEAVFDESLDAMVITDDEGRYIQVNSAAEQLFGVAEDTLLGRRIGDFAADGIDVDEMWQAFRHEGELSGEFTLARPGGSDRIVEFAATADIVPGAHLSVLRDVTERREHERRFDAIFNNAYQFMGLLEPDGTLLEANQPALDFGGLDSDDVIGERFWETDWFGTSEQTRARVQDAIVRASEGEFVRMEVTVQGETQEAILDFSIRPVRDEGGSVTLLVPEGRNITELKETGRIASDSPVTW